MLENQERPTHELHDIKGKLATTVGLTGVAVSAYLGRRYNLIHELPDGQQAVVESMSHPVFGYVGAFVASGLVKSDKVKRATIAVGAATAINFGVEIAQDAAVYNDMNNENSFYANTPETIKDYSFALGGVALYALHDKLTKRHSQPLMQPGRE